MSRSSALRCLCILACGLTLAAGPATAASGLRFSPGPTTIYLPEVTFYPVIAELINTGDTADQYHVTLTKSIPDDWVLTLCDSSLCYAPQVTEFTIPPNRSLDPGERRPIDLNITKMSTLGTGTFTITIVSDSNPALRDQVTYTVLDPGNDPVAFHFSTGTNILEAEINEFVRFHTALFNIGTQEDAYTVTVTRDHPQNWVSTICYDGICYAPTQSTFRVPEADYVYAGEVMDIDIDVTPMVQSGIGTLQIRIESLANHQVAAEYTFHVATGSLIAVGDQTPAVALERVYAAPNPFNPRTEICFAVGGDQARTARIDVYDMRGRQVRTLDAGTVEPGAHRVEWDGRGADGGSLGAGVYLARVHVGDQCQDVKMSLVK
jgi:hypothetical protein